MAGGKKVRGGTAVKIELFAFRGIFHALEIDAGGLLTSAGAAERIGQPHAKTVIVLDGESHAAPAGSALEREGLGSSPGSGGGVAKCVYGVATLLEMDGKR